jgi:spore germination protein
MHKIYRGGVEITIHIVREGDSLYEIAKLYNIDYKKIADDNKIPINQELVIGQTIVIDTDNIKNFREIKVNGYAFPNIDMGILNEVLHSLTYLSLFSYHINYGGYLDKINDDDLISIAKNYNVIPVMVVTNIGKEDRFDSNLVHYVLNNDRIQNKLINEIFSIMHIKGYMGLNIDFEYVYPKDKEAYINFIKKVKRRIKNYNYFLTISVAPKTSDEQKGLLYEAHDYKQIGELADHVVIMTYEWGYSGGPARSVAPVNLIEEVLSYATERIPSNKILMGIPNYGYNWTLPYLEGNIAKSIGNYEAVKIARKNNQAISYNYEEQAPFFNYYDEKKAKHEVWFEDARSIQTKLELVLKYNLEGVSYWTLNKFFPQNYLVLNSLFDIKKE